MTEMRRALVCALMPEDDRDSGSRRVMHLLDHLQEADWTVTFVSHHANPRARYLRALQHRGIEVYAGAAKWMDQLVATGAYDLAVFGLWDIAEPFMGRIRARSPRTRIVIDSIDLHFLRNARRAFVEGGRTGSLDDDYGSAMTRELNTYAAADAVLTVSQKEAELIGDFIGDPALAWAVPDGEDIEPSTVPLSDRRGMVYIGCYRFSPNVDAVQHLCTDILPHLRRSLLDQHRVYIVGDGLDDKVRAFGRSWPQVSMVGWVPSVTPYLDQARVNVVPLRYGAGTKRKVVHALMRGTPTVCTRVGAEGLGLRHEEHVLIADTAATFAEATRRVLEDDVLWQRLHQAGAAHIRALHGREVPREKLREVLVHVMGRPAKQLRAGSEAPQPAVWTPASYRELVTRLTARVETVLPATAGVIVVSKGDDALLRFNGRQAWHFPQGDDGNYAGHYPANGQQAITQLEKLRRRVGASHVVLPATAAWWLEHYPEFARHLDKHYVRLHDERDTGLIFARQDGSHLPDVRVTSRAAADQRAVAGADNAASTVRLIAFLLPQFHPIPENDAWWGKGFTEWSNVTSARPQFAGHYQPRLPSELGFYDLRLPEVRERQAELARAHGLHGFCYYHYWFGGKRLLERPFNEVLASKTPRFPFCLCWANEPWSRRWDGRPHEVLQPQPYDHEDDRRHIRALIPALTDDRAIRIDGKPVFIVYQAKDLPDAGRTVEIWREEVQKAGLREGLYLMACETGWDAGVDLTASGFDAKILFQPQFSLLFGSGARIPIEGKDSLRVFDYQKAWPVLANPDAVSYRRYDTVFPTWDNTARIGERAVVLHNSTPEAYQAWLETAIGRALVQPPDQRVVFINAWNEWAEGCHLEPDQRHGRSYLEATHRALTTTGASPHPVAVTSAAAGDLFVTSLRASRPTGSGARVGA